MIVDDHAEMRRTLKTIVSFSLPKEVDFIECESGEEAVERYSIESPDCVLMDIQLKEIDGFEATQRIYNYHSQAKVIIVTSHIALSIKKRAESLGVSGFITKDNLSGISPLLSTIITK